MTPDQLATPPTELEVSELLSFLNSETTGNGVPVFRRLCHQRDKLLARVEVLEKRLESAWRNETTKQREAREAAEKAKETPTNEQQVEIKRLQLYANLFSACDKSQADRAAEKAGKGE